MSKHIAIIGIGAIGGYFGARMVRSGIDVTMIDQWPANVARITSEGLRIDGFDADDSITVRADIRDIGAVQSLVRERPIDTLFVAVKSYDTVWATHLMLPYLAPDGIVVSLQNAVNEPAIAGIVGEERTYGCAILSLACDMVAPGQVKRMSPSGSVMVGAMGSDEAGRVDDIAAMLTHGETSRTTDNLIGVKWSKLIINAMRNGLSAMTGMSGLERDSNPVTIKLGILLGAQAVRVGRASGHVLEDTGYRFDALVAAGDGDPEAIAEIHRAMSAIANARSADQRPSMAQDIRKGRRTETDAINGFVARTGRRLGVDASAHEKVHEMLLEIERGRLEPSPALAEAVVAAL